MSLLTPRTQIGKLLPIIILVMLAGALRWQSTFDHSLNPDEGIAYLITHPLEPGDAMKTIRINADPPLYYVLLRLFAGLGLGVVPLRLCSFLFGCLAVSGAYLLGNKIGGRVAGFLTGLLLAISPSAILMSQVIRSYSVLTMLTVFCLFFFVSWMKKPTISSLTGWAVCLLAAVLTHYTAVIMLGALMVILVLTLVTSLEHRSWLTRAAIAFAPSLVALLLLCIFHIWPNLIGSRLQTAAQDDWLKPFFIKSPADAWHAILGVACYLVGTNTGGPQFQLAAAGVATALFRHQIAIAALPIAAFGAAVVMSVAGQLPFGGSRHSVCTAMFMLIPIASLASAVVAVALSRSIRAFAYVALACALLTAGEPLGRYMGVQRAVISRQEEQITPAADYARIVSAFWKASEAGSIILCDIQSYHCLAVEVYDWEKNLGPPGTRISLVPDYRDTRIAVADEWSLTLGEEPENSYRKFAGFMESVDAAMPDWGLKERKRVWIVQGGRIVPLAPALARLNSHLPDNQKFLLETHSAPGLELMAVDPCRFLRSEKNGAGELPQ